MRRGETSVMHLAWDAENRLIRAGGANPGAAPPPPGTTPGPHRIYLPAVAFSPLVEQYSYDGDGARVRKITADANTYYVAPHYEVEVAGGQTMVTKYYAFNGQRVAMRLPDGSLNYLHADHLSSTLLATDEAGAVVGNNQPRYDAYGGERVASVGSLPTDLAYTGQRRDDTGLLYYGARFYDPALGTFVQPDTIVPDPGDPSSMNRYAYGWGNPVKYTDPTGHFSEEELLDTCGAFIGPKQLHSTRDRRETAYWYYLLRAAELGDTVKFWGVEQGNVAGQIIAQDGKLWIAGSDGGKYGVGWEGIGGTGSGIIAQASQPTEANGVAFHTKTKLRRFVNGPRSTLDAPAREVVGRMFQHRTESSAEIVGR